MTYESLSREQRAQLLLSDPQAYTEAVPLDKGYWWLLLDGIAKLGGYVEDRG